MLTLQHDIKKVVKHEEEGEDSTNTNLRSGGLLRYALQLLALISGNS